MFMSFTKSQVPPNNVATHGEEGELVTTTSANAIPSTPPQQQTIAKLVSPDNTANYTSLKNFDLSYEMNRAHEPPAAATNINDLKPHAQDKVTVKHTLPMVQLDVVIGNDQTLLPATERTVVIANDQAILPATKPTVNIALNIPTEPIIELIDIEDDIEDDPRVAIPDPAVAVTAFVPALIPPNSRAVTVPGSAKKSWPNRVTAVTTPGTMIAFLYLPRDNNKGVHESCLTRIETSEAYTEIKKKFHFFSFPPMVSLTNPEEPILNMRSGQDGGQDRHCILRLIPLETPIDNSMVDAWGTEIANLIEHFSGAKYNQYTTLYRYVGNITPPQVAPLSCYLPLADCSHIIVLHERTTCNRTHTIPRTLLQLLEIPDLTAKYFMPDHLLTAKALAAHANIQTQQPLDPGGYNNFLNNLPAI
jgi:hypothetical protein